MTRPRSTIPIGPKHHRQAGAALLIALLAVLLASVMALHMIEQSQRAVARTEALLNSERAWQYAHGMKAVALDWIEQADQQPGTLPAALSGRWAPPLPVPGGTVMGRVFDLSGQFNLNRLDHPDPEQALYARLALDRLLLSLNIDANLTTELQGWIRADSSSQGGLYAQATPAYLRPGMRLAHISELGWLQRYTPQNNLQLAALVAAIPDPSARLNINQVSARVLAAWLDGLSPEQAERILSAGPYETLAALRAQPDMAPYSGLDLEVMFSVRSQWYLTQARVTLNGQPQDFFYLINRGGTGYDFRYLSQTPFEPALVGLIAR
ncbi:MAG: type II secretion system minor pseudopilin GspK [Pseudomonadota bacterium]